jgi:hypothetical protein
MKFCYKRINIKNTKDIATVEKLVEKGWKIILTGIDYYLLEK